ncbi:tetratricopeptide repeat protein [Caballeronia humi]|uniref:TPR repeat-containing protein n=1 Tax=Caballeronia humi TaxID=326474 RepID=A0A158GEL9_9BURK|nr:tetratricopeptide repeat protein [Caballeronia humi]SAL30564.1 TPR repeat-containing protein [Caballeronia humi]
MTRSPKIRRNPTPATHSTRAVVQDDIISRVLPVYFANAQAAAQRSQTSEQAVWLQAALILQPEHIEARLQLIDVMLKRGAIGEAITVAANLVEREPQHALALWHLGYALQLAGHHAEAVPFYQRAYDIDNSVPTLRNNFAVALEVTGHPDEALRLLEEAVAENNNDIEAWTNLTRIYPQRCELEHALAAGKRAMQIDPSNALAQSNYSLTLKEAQRWSDATAAALVAAETAPQMARFPFNLSLLDLLQRNYPRGWKNFETRWDGSNELGGSHPEFAVPRWNGEALHGKTLLLWGEQGFGDALQFCRFVPMLAKQVHAQGGKLVWVAFKALHPLMARMAPKNVECVAHDAELPPHDFQFPLLSLPLYFNIDDESIPAKRSYLSADVDRAAHWRAQMPAAKQLRVGLVWSGGATHQRNMFRSVGIDRYAKAFGALENVAFFSLQKGAQGDVASAQQDGLTIADHTGEFDTFDDTAAFINSLDLVITVCTSVAHLAAALGKPTWILLDANPHWVWQLERTDSPWYPTATLYRQKQFAQWEPVFDDLTRDLTSLATKHASAAAAKRRTAKKLTE